MSAVVNNFLNSDLLHQIGLPALQVGLYMYIVFILAVNWICIVQHRHYHCVCLQELTVNSDVLLKKGVGIRR